MATHGQRWAHRAGGDRLIPSKHPPRPRQKVYNLPLDADLWEALGRQAHLEERSKAQVLRRALRDYIASWEPLRGS